MVVKVGKTQPQPGRGADVRGACAGLAAVAKKRGRVALCGGVGRRRHASPSPPPMHKAAAAATSVGDAVVGGHG